MILGQGQKIRTGGSRVLDSYGRKRRQQAVPDSIQRNVAPIETLPKPA